MGEAKRVTFVPCYGVAGQREAYAIKHPSELTPEQKNMAFTIELQ